VTATATRRTTARTRRRPPGPLAAAHALAAAVVAAGLLAQVVRPLAPDLGTLPPPGVFFDPALLARAEAYRAPLRAAGVAGLLLSLAVPLAVACSRPGRRLLDALRRRGGRPEGTAVLVAVGIVVAVDLVALPLSFWAGYVHEGRWGFRTQGLAGWARDWLVVHVPVWLGVAVLAAGASILVRRLPRAWPPVAGLAGAVLAALLVFVAPLVLEPLSFRLEPLGEGPVRAEVERVLSAADMEVGALLVADASRRTTKENAYVSGLGPTRRVVLYDTLLANRAPEVVGLTLAHELGHARNGDIARNALFAAAGAVAGAYALAVVLGAAGRGRAADPVSPRAVAAGVAALLVLNAATLPLQTWVSRRAEAAADLAALELTGDPETFLALQRALAASNLVDPDPPRWSYLLWWTHPTTVARMEMAVRWGVDR
jgi:STE24 endopeptidase